MNKRLLAAALGHCVHVSGIYHFLSQAEAAGYETIMLGPAISPSRLIAAILQQQPDLVAVSYRLTPDVLRELLGELRQLIDQHQLSSLRLVFGGTPSVAQVARESGLFEQVFTGEEPPEAVQYYLMAASGTTPEQIYAQDLVGRIQQKYPYPLLRHHFGRPSLRETIEGVRQIAESSVLEVISLGPDQNAQEYFFRPDQMDVTQDGAGGVPVRHADDLRAIYSASRCGNYPLLRCYSGTQDLIRWAEMSVQTIHNAWGAIPLCWYSVLDGRSQRSLIAAISENQQTMRWYAEHQIPVEVNESHQWSLREAHDSLAVAMAFLAAYNAKAMGVRHYVAQYMFNTPPGTSPKMDLAKMLAKKQLIEELQDSTFTVFTEVRPGIAHFSVKPAVAKGQLAASAVIGLALAPHIFHVVGFSEGDHATNAEELIESCQIVHGVLQNCLLGLPNMMTDQDVQRRKHELLTEAKVLLDTIKMVGQSASDDPWCDPPTLARAITIGLLDTPHFRENPHLSGKIKTQLVAGAWYAIEPKTGQVWPEQERVKNLLAQMEIATKL